MAVEPSTQISPETYARAERLLARHSGRLIFRSEVRPHWINEGDRFWYRLRTAEGHEFVLVDPNRASREPAFDHERLAASLSRARGVFCGPDSLPFHSIAFSADGETIEFDDDSSHWQADASGTECRRLGPRIQCPAGELWSPDGQWAAFVSGDNLLVRHNPSGKVTALTGDGEPFFDYGVSPESRLSTVTERVRGIVSPPIAVWSPDSKRLATHHLDQRRVRELHLLQSVPGDGSCRPVLQAYRYPLLGDEHIAQLQHVIFHVANGVRVDVDAVPEPVIEVSSIEWQQVWWSEDGERLYFIQRDRGDKALRLVVADARTGATRCIVEERRAWHVDANLREYGRPNVRVLSGGCEVIWFSERDGWGHLYLLDASAERSEARPITAGPFVVRDIVHVDEANRLLYFSASGREGGRDPYYRHLYRVRMDGSGMERLSPEDAEHEITMSPSGRFFVDTFSRVDLPPVSVLRSSDGTLIRELEEADIRALLATGWRAPERVCVRAADGATDLYGLIYRPSGFDPEAKYPVLDSIYPGPQIIRTPEAFGLDGYGQAEAIAELGFIVVTIDGRGTPFRSRALHDCSIGKLQDAGGLEDHIAGLRQLAARYPEMDLERVGIYGHSCGGYASAHAILAYPDFFEVAVASAGNHDQRGYHYTWGERFQGWLEGGGYEAQSNVGLAQNLRGKLLLACSDMDDNVHPAMILQLVDALIRANKDFDLLVLPNRTHQFHHDLYFTRRRWDYLVRHLLGKEPPAGYRIGSQDAP